MWDSSFQAEDLEHDGVEQIWLLLGTKLVFSWVFA